MLTYITGKIQQSSIISSLLSLTCRVQIFHTDSLSQVIVNIAFLLTQDEQIYFFKGIRGDTHANWKSTLILGGLTFLYKIFLQMADRSLLKYHFRHESFPDHLFKKQQNKTKQNPSLSPDILCSFSCAILLCSTCSYPTYLHGLSLYFLCVDILPLDCKFYKSRPFVCLVQLQIFSRCLAHHRCTVSIVE